MELWTYLFIIAQSCAQILLICVTGYTCARIGIINGTVQKGLSELTVNILMPCLLFSQVASGIDLDTLVRLWPIPMFIGSFALISGSLGIIGGKLLHLTTPQTKFASAGIIFNNLTSLTLPLMYNIGTSEAIEILLWGKNDTPSEATKRGISYVLLATLLGNLLRWTLGAQLLRKEEDPISEAMFEVEEARSTYGHSRYYDRCSKSSYETLEFSGNFCYAKNGLKSTETTPLFYSDSQSPSPSPSPSSSSSSSSSSSFSSFSRKITNSVKNIATTIGKVMNPPLYAAIIALIVGATPTLKSLFFGKAAPFYPTITRAMICVGDTAVPLTLLVLGAQLSNIPRSKGGNLFPALGWVMFCRFLIMPFIGIGIVMWTRDWFSNDPMLWFALMFLAAGPSAVNCINITQLTGAFQEEMAALLFYSYAAVAPILTVSVMVMFLAIEKAKLP
ncbi:hypothetical protein G9A89_007424 [Geosiphon pyriformis]|nr:hypothetical protein G9A89_007424 [Geosiphon pyriformis]